MKSSKSTTMMYKFFSDFLITLLTIRLFCNMEIRMWNFLSKILHTGLFSFYWFSGEIKCMYVPDRFCEIHSDPKLNHVTNFCSTFLMWSHVFVDRVPSVIIKGKQELPDCHPSSTGREQEGVVETERFRPQLRAMETRRCQLHYAYRKLIGLSHSILASYP